MSTTLLAALFAMGAVPAMAQDDHTGGTGDPIHEQVFDEDNPARKLLDVEPALLNLGTLNRGDTVHKTVKVTNKSDRPILITRTFATCGCTLLTAPEAPIQPGETIELEIEYTAKNEGPSSSLVRLFLAEGLGDVRIGVQALVEAPIVLDPPFFDAGITEDLPLTVRSNDGTEFRIMAADPGVIDGIDDERRVEHHVTINAAKLRASGNNKFRIRLYVDHKRIDSVLLRSNLLVETPATSRLFDWARGEGELIDLVSIMDDGTDLDVTDPQGRTAMMIAAQSGQFERVHSLMEFGADVRVRARDGQDALMKAAQATEGTAKLVQLLLDAGADVNASDNFGRTPLFWAARSADAERLQILLDRGAEVDVRGPSRETPLIAAIKARSLENIKTLVEAGANVKAADSRGRRAYDWAKIQLAFASTDEQKALINEIIAYIGSHQ